MFYLSLSADENCSVEFHLLSSINKEIYRLFIFFNVIYQHFLTPNNFAASSADLVSIWSTIDLSSIPNKLLIRSVSSSTCPLRAGLDNVLLFIFEDEAISDTVILSTIVGESWLVARRGLRFTWSSGGCFFLCLNMLCFRVNRRKHKSQANGRSPVCVRMWRRRSSADQKRRIQKAHTT